MRNRNWSLRGLQSERSGIAALEFAFLAPALLALAFGVIVYSIYFTAVMGVRQAAAEGARAAMAGLSLQERTALAKTRATAVLANYGALVGGAPRWWTPWRMAPGYSR